MKRLCLIAVAVGSMALFSSAFRGRKVVEAPPIAPLLAETQKAALPRPEKVGATNEFVLNLTKLTSWVESDLTGVISWYESEPSGDLLHLQARHLIIERLLEHPPETAFSLLKDRDLIFSLFEKWARRDPDLAAETLSLFKNPEQTLKDVATHWCRSDAPAAERWLITLPEIPAKEAALAEARERVAIENIKGRWAVLSPERAAATVGTLRPGAEQNQAALDIVSAWAAIEPDRAASWVERFPEGEVRNEAIERVLNFWMPMDAVAAREWSAGVSRY